MLKSTNILIYSLNVKWKPYIFEGVLLCAADKTTKEIQVVPPFPECKVCSNLSKLNAAEICVYESVNFTILYVSVVKSTLCCGNTIYA